MAGTPPPAAPRNCLGAVSCTFRSRLTFSSVGVYRPCGWICLLRPARARQVPAGRVAAPTRRHLSLLTGVMSLRRLDSWPDLPVFAGVSLARAAALLWHRNRPTVSVGCKWTGLAVETDEAQSGESVQKTRQVPPVGRTLCWADAC